MLSCLLLLLHYYNTHMVLWLFLLFTVFLLNSIAFSIAKLQYWNKNICLIYLDQIKGTLYLQYMSKSICEFFENYIIKSNMNKVKQNFLFHFSVSKNMIIMAREKTIFRIVSWLHSVGYTAYRFHSNKSMITPSRTESKVFPDHLHTPSLSTPQGPTQGHGWDRHTQTCQPTHTHAHTNIKCIGVRWEQNSGW